MFKPCVVLTVAFACFAVATSSAIAETEVPTGNEPVTVLNEGTGDPCGGVTVVNDVASGSCALHASSPSAADWTSHSIFGESVVARCLYEFEGAVNGSGEGRIGAAQLVFTNPPSGGIDCTGTGAARPCTELEAVDAGANHQANWHIRIVEELSTDRLWMEARVCIAELPWNRPVAGRVWFRLTEDMSHHPTSVTATDHRLLDDEGTTTAIPDAELTGGWTLEQDASHQGIEVIH